MAGWLYLAVVMDLFSRKVVGWSAGPTIRRELVLDALLTAVRRRRPRGTVIHSDQGTQYSSDAWRRFCRSNHLEPSMSRKGNCWDNAVAESFFGSLKKERIKKQIYKNRELALTDVADYIDAFYNRTRRHSHLDGVSPDQFEAAHKVRVEHRPRLLSDNGPCYVSAELATYLETHQLTHTRGAPYHPMTQGKIERYHRSIKNVVKLEKYYSPWALERAIARFVEHYNHRRLHEALDSVTPADVYEGRRPAILARREQTKRRTLAQRKREKLCAPRRAVNRQEVSLMKQTHWSELT
jgi:transposase InsO family protein